jgi:FKBP-type peptidyl-prolyl cis-trans isomerase SlyD
MTDTIQDGKVAKLAFKLTDDDGDTIDEATAEDPISYLHGAGNLVPGLEAALQGKGAGATVKITVPPEEGYGPREPFEPQPIPREHFPDEVELEVAMPFVVEADDGEELELFVAAIGDEEVYVDINHPLAGLNLHFDVTVLEVRDSTADEREHGHPHDEGPCDPGMLN